MEFGGLGEGYLYWVLKGLSVKEKDSGTMPSMEFFLHILKGVAKLKLIS